MSLKKTVLLSVSLFCYQTEAIKIVTTGAPKSGIGMLTNCLKELTNTKKTAKIDGDMILSEKQLQRNDLIIGTPVYNQHNVQLIEKYKAKIIYIIRDPRDQIATTAKTVYQYRSLIPAARSKSMAQIIEELITGGSIFYTYQYAFEEVKQIKGITQLYNFWLPWIDHPNALTVTFEHLCGAHGTNIQQKEILLIAGFLDIRCTMQQASRIAHNMQKGGLFGMFKKKPTTDNWKKLFTSKHKQKCKEIAGQLLIELGYETNLHW